jgi:hypothetical protein
VQSHQGCCCGVPLFRCGLPTPVRRRIRRIQTLKSR